MKNKFIIINIAVAVIWGGLFALQVVSRTQAESAAVVFDHSQCQYPDRLSNPANGCDNSDPACPLETKGGSCENYQPTAQEIAPWVPTTTAPVVTAVPALTNTCK